MTTYEGTPFEKFAKQALGPPAQDVFDFGIGRMFGLLDEARDQVRELRCAPDGPHVVALIDLLAAIRRRIEGLEMEVRALAAPWRGKRKMTIAKMMATIAFNYEAQPDPDGAAEALHDAGYVVHRFPEHMRHLLAHPFDDLIEAVIAGADIDAIWQEVDSVVGAFGGACEACGEIGDAYVPFNQEVSKH